MKKLSFLICALLLGVIVRAQELPTIIPPAPEARKMIEYGNVPVSYNTGIPGISVPMYSFEAGGITIPITLSYHASGTKVNDSEGITGLKWLLTNGGGSISRTINGRPDEDIANPISGWLNAAKILDLNNLSNSQESHLSYMANGCVDLQPDEYNYSLPSGVSGKFVFGENQEIIQIPQNENVKIETYFNGSVDQGWKITDTNGFLYIFKTHDYNNNSTTSGQVSNSNPCPITYVASSWFLDSVIMPNGEEINYSYISDTYSESIQSSETQFLTEIIPNNYNGLMSDFVNNFLPIFSYSRGYFNLKLLSNIRYKKMEINFEYSQKSDDTDEGKKLDSLYVTYDGEHITGYEFHYLFNSNQRMFLDQIDQFGTNQSAQLFRKFEYHNYDELPERGSFSIDEFDYYNAENNHRLIPGGSYRLGNVSVIPSNYSCDLFTVELTGADRSLNSDKVHTGTLSKIIYPTKGWTAFEYEPNMGYYGEIEEDHVKFFFSGAPYNEPLGWQVQYSNYFEVTKNKLDFTSLKVTLFNQTGDPGLNWTRPSFDLIDENGTVHYSRTLREEGENILNCDDVTFNDLPNGNYRLKVSLFNSSPNIPSPYVYSVVIRGRTFFDTLVNNKYYGGVRVASISNYDNNGLLELQKTYDYSSFENPEQSSGKILGKSTFFKEEATFKYFVKKPIGSDIDLIYIGDQSFTRISSSISPLLAYNRNSPVLYENVKENFIGNQEQYSIKRYYKNYGINRLGFDQQIKTGKLFTPHSLEEYSNGILWKEERLNKDNFVVNSIEHDYNFVPVINDRVIGFVVKNYRVWDVHELDYSKEFRTAEYDVFSRWFVNKKKTTISHYENSSLTSLTQSFYDNTKHKLVTRTETTNSNGDVVISKTKYPEDLSTKTTAEQKLIDQHRIATPIEITSSLKRGTNPAIQLSKVYNVYKNWGSNVILPEIVKTSKNQSDLKPRIQYYDYDDYGNPLEVSQTDGSHSIYIWGYHDEYPIAKITNATYTGMPTPVRNLINQIRTTSNSESTPANEDTLRSQLESLRTNDFFTNAQMSYYTYDPLVGVTSITDPRGYTMTYHYDDFNRLEFVKDADGKLVSENTYNYKN